ncbi:LysR family transcriptional regulator [Desulfovibrio sp.]
MHPHDLDLDSLATLAAVVDAGGFTAASRLLNRTQSAVSAKIAALEQAAGSPLLLRSRRGVAPTPAGKTLLGYARDLLRLREEAALALDRPQASGILRLGLPDECVNALVTPLAARFAEAHPGLELEIRCDLSVRLEEDLAAGNLDLVVTVREPGSLKGDLLLAVDQYWCAPPGRFPERLRPLPLALFSEGCRTRPAVLAALAAAGIPSRTVFSASHVAGLVSAAAGGLALTALMADAVPQGWRRPGAKAGLPSLPRYEAALLTPPEASPNARLLAEFLLAEMRGKGSAHSS